MLEFISLLFPNVIGLYVVDKRYKLKNIDKIFYFIINTLIINTIITFIFYIKTKLLFMTFTCLFFTKYNILSIFLNIVVAYIYIFLKDKIKIKFTRTKNEKNK